MCCYNNKLICCVHRKQYLGPATIEGKGVVVDPLMQVEQEDGAFGEQVRLESFWWMFEPAQ